MLAETLSGFTQTVQAKADRVHRNGPQWPFQKRSPQESECRIQVYAYTTLSVKYFQTWNCQINSGNSINREEVQAVGQFREPLSSYEIGKNL
jgi:hypothetical protein